MRQKRRSEVAKRVTIGPVDSKHAGFDDELRAFLLGKGFTADSTGIQWTKEFDGAIAAEAAVEAVYAQIGRLVEKHAPQLPQVSLL